MAITLRNTKGIALTHNELDGNFTDLNDRTTCLESCASNSITSTQIDNWDCAYGWGDHSQAGYCTTETSHADVVVDGDFTSSGLMTTDGNGAYSITTNNSSNWDCAYGWGDHSQAGYCTTETSHADVVVDGDFTSSGLMTTDGSGAYTVTTNNSADWDCAYGWGDHSQAGYTCYSNTDVDGHLNQANPTGGYVLSWNGNDYEWVAQSGGSGSTNSIAQDDTNVTVTDTGTDGHIDFQTENTVRWTVNCSGHIVPNGNACYDIGEAENKVRHFYLSPNSLKFVEDGTNTEYPLGVTGGQLFFNGEQVSGGGGGGTADASLTWTITKNSYSSSFEFSGPGIETGNTFTPELQLIRGYTYKFSDASDNPTTFRIRTSLNGSDYAAGVTTSGNLTTFTVPYDAPDTLYYQTTYGSLINGVIKIVNANNGLSSRTNVSASHSVPSGVSVSKDITGYKGYNLYKITTNDAARVIVYTSGAARTADAGRAEGTDPAPNAGVIAEVVTTGAETITLSPGVVGYNDDPTVSNIIPIKITNKSPFFTTISATLTIVQTEA